MSLVAIKQYTSVLSYHFLASAVCDVNLKLSRNKGGPKQNNISFQNYMSEITQLDLRASQPTNATSVNSAIWNPAKLKTNFTDKT